MDGSCSPLRLQSVWMDSWIPSAKCIKYVFCHLLQLAVLVGDDIRLGWPQNTKEQQLLTANVPGSAQYTFEISNFSDGQIWCNRNSEYTDKSTTKKYFIVTWLPPYHLGSALQYLPLTIFLEPLKGFFSFVYQTKLNTHTKYNYTLSLKAPRIPSKYHLCHSIH